MGFAPMAGFVRCGEGTDVLHAGSNLAQAGVWGKGVCRDAWGLGDAVVCRALPGKVRRMAGLSPFVRLDRRTIA